MRRGRVTEAGVAPVSAGSFAWFALAFTVVAVLGRLTAAADRGPALVWPAAGVGLLWLLLRPGRAWAVATLTTMSVLLVAANGLTGASAGLVVGAVGAGLTQTSLTVLGVRRWCPDLLGAGGCRTLTRPRALLRFLAAAGLGTLAGATVGTALSALVEGGVAWSTLPLWWGRNLGGMLLVGTAGHLLLHAVLTGRRLRPEPGRAVELGLIVVASVVSFVLIDLEQGQPVAFLLIGTSVWCALRFPTVVAALQVVSTGAVALLLAILDHGPAASIADPLQALTMQVFVVMLLVVALAIGSTREERNDLLDELRATQREAAERAEFLETVTEEMTEGLVVMNVDGSVRRMNSAARSLLGRTATGVQPGTRTGDYAALRPDGSLLPPEDYPAVRALAEGRVPPVDVVLPLGDGTSRTLSVSSAALYGEAEAGGAAPVGSVAVYRDVTDERRHADQLAEFAATAAHDLRSPLTALRGWLELAADSGDPVVQQALGRAREAALRMQDLITDLLAQASAEGGLLTPDELESVPLETAVDDAASYLDRDADLTRADELPVVAAHPELLRQLLANLLGNAVKYVDPGVRPEVVVTAGRVGDRVAVEVRDNGIGVPEEERERVFDRLHRAHVGDTRFEGTGLGLAICRTIVARHGGHIACRPAPGGGTAFCFDLPAAVPDVATIAPGTASGCAADAVPEAAPGLAAPEAPTVEG